MAGALQRARLAAQPKPIEIVEAERDDQQVVIALGGVKQRFRRIALDIDFFKAINDSHGHDAGDDVLREFAVRIRKSIRGIDLACRYGGEEFVIVMPETDLHVAGMVAERLRRSIAGEPFAVNKGANRIEVTISIGLSTLELKGEAVADVLKRADTALYRAKHDGRNRVVATAA